ncbi:hypothetical protein [Sinomonas atrocyanea]
MQGFYALWFCLAVGASAVVRDLLGVDAFIKRDPERGAARLSFRRAARELPGFWFFVASFLLGVWGMGAFSLAVALTGSPESAGSVTCAAAVFFGILALFAWITWTAVGRRHSR